MESESTELARPSEPQAATPGHRPRAWAWAAVLAALLAAAATVWLLGIEQARHRQTAAALDGLRQARADLSRGLAQALMAGHAARASERESAAGLMSHAAASLREFTPGTRSQDDLAARLRNDAAVFREHLAEWGAQTPPSALSTAGLQIAYRRLEATADGVDGAMRAELAADGTRDRRLLVTGAAATALLLAAASLVLVRRIRNVSASARAAPAGRPPVEAIAGRGSDGAASREGEERYRTLVESMADGVFVAQDHRFVYANDALPRLLGYTHAEFIGKPFSEIVAPESLELWTSRFERRIGAGEEPPRHYEANFLDRHGQPVPIELRASRYRHHERPAVLGIVRDVTERNRAEGARRLLASIVESSDDAIISVDLDGIITSWNKGAEVMYLYGAAEAIGQPIGLLMPPEFPEEERALVAHVRQGMAMRHSEAVRRRKDGSAVEVSITVSPLRNRHGEVIGASTSARDISARRRADAALREREEIYSAIVNQAADGIVLVDMSTARFVEFNDAACEVLGYTREEFAQLGISDVFLGSAEEMQRVGQAILDAPGGLQLDVRHRRKDGSVREVLVSARTLRLRGKGYSAAIWRDITDERRAAAALRESEHRLRELAESLPQLVWTCAPAGECDYIGPQWVAYTGIGAAAQLGRRWLEQVHPEDRAAVTAAWAASISSGNALDAEFRLRGHDGEYRWFYARAVPLRDVEGRITKWFGTGTDVTDRRAAEQRVRALNVELEERVKERTAQLAAANAELETFAYSVSHDLKAPLRSIDGYGKLLLHDYGEKLGEEGREFIENVRRATLQMNNLIDDLLAYSRIERQQLSLDELEIEAVVQLALGERREELAAREIELKLALPPRLAAKADLDGLLIVLRNLIENAIKFTRDATPPRIEIGGRENPHSVEIWVRDNGIGFDMKFQERIFEIFQRLQRAEEYPGTGVGLALVRRALTRMGGRVRCESSPGQGATFFVELPR